MRDIESLCEKAGRRVRQPRGIRRPRWTDLTTRESEPLLPPHNEIQTAAVCATASVRSGRVPGTTRETLAHARALHPAGCLTLVGGRSAIARAADHRRRKPRDRRLDVQRHRTGWRAGAAGGKERGCPAPSGRRYLALRDRQPLGNRLNSRAGPAFAFPEVAPRPHPSSSRGRFPNEGGTLDRLDRTSCSRCCSRQMRAQSRTGSKNN